MNEALLPCPFCGEQPWFRREHPNQDAMIRCENDDCPAHPEVTMVSNELTIRGWNTRTPQAGEMPDTKSAELAADARRYQRLRILGCAPSYTEHLKNGNVMRFSNLDEFLDADIQAHPSRGEARTPQAGGMPGREELLKRANEYLSTVLNKGDCGPHHLVSDLAAALAQPSQEGRETLLAKAAQDFIDKVDRGEARSKESYAAFKAALLTPSRPTPSEGG